MLRALTICLILWLFIFLELDKFLNRKGSQYLQVFSNFILYIIFYIINMYLYLYIISTHLSRTWQYILKLLKLRKCICIHMCMHILTQTLLSSQNSWQKGRKILIFHLYESLDSQMNERFIRFSDSITWHTVLTSLVI